MGMGDIKVAEARGYEAAHALILKACKKAFENPANRANCSGFVKAVANELGIVSIGKLGAGQANDIYDEIGRPPWVRIGSGRDGAVRAAYCARQGNFVVAAWKNASAGGHGHVGIVTDLDLATLKFKPIVSDRNVLAAWGVLNHEELARNGGAIRQTFSPANKMPDVIYAWHPIVKFG